MPRCSWPRWPPRPSPPSRKPRRSRRPPRRRKERRRRSPRRSKPRAGHPPLRGQENDPRGADRRRARRAGVAGSPQDRHALRVVPDRQRRAAGRDHLLRHLQRLAPPDRLRGPRPRARQDPRPPDGPRRHRHLRGRRLRGHEHRHLQRRAAGDPVPGQPARRAGRRHLRRVPGRRRLRLGRDLGLGGPDRPERLRGRDLDPLLADAFPAHQPTSRPGASKVSATSRAATATASRPSSPTATKSAPSARRTRSPVSPASCPAATSRSPRP